MNEEKLPSALSARQRINAILAEVSSRKTSPQTIMFWKEKIPPKMKKKKTQKKES